MAARDARSIAWRKHVWWAYLIVGAVVCALYLFVSPLKGSGPVINGLGLSGVVAVLAGIQMNRPSARVPWWCFVLGLFLFWLGDMYTYSYPKLFNVAVPFPSVGDAIYLAVYPALMLGLLVLVRRRNRGGDGPGLIDSLIMSVGLALISGVTLIAPYAHDPTMSLLPKLVSIGYPMGDIILLAAVIRLAVDAGKRRPSFYLLTASIVTLLSTDFVYGILTLHGNYNHQLWLDAGWIFFYLLWGAAALHPSMGELDHSAAARQPRLTPLRLALLTGACLIAPAIEVIKVLHHPDADMLAIIGVSVALFGLVVWRMAGLVRQREKSIAREAALTSAGAMLVAATSRSDIALAALRSASDVTREDVAIRMCRIDADAMTVSRLTDDSDELDAWPAGRELGTMLLAGGELKLSDPLRASLRLPDLFGQALVFELDKADRDPRELLVVAGAATPAPDSRQALATLANQVALALESVGLSE
ncbi:MAG: hypothetical protein QOG59_1552, partial [Solirubrobacteraceae bacterium]|nr:hypothetical protein [Solirubrobacteraceae bacterium]